AFAIQAGRQQVPKIGSASFPGLCSISRHKRWNEHLQQKYCTSHARFMIIFKITINQHVKELAQSFIQQACREMSVSSDSWHFLCL
ncbi:hypothetical protein, partial [Pantoea agglomerans]|uniref:hypothetical protein n=1 Tax=Enterobacter agglomerans TaxID=549 RepID=UPI00320B6AC0